MLVFAFTACKTTKKQPQSIYTADPATQPKVFSVPETVETVKSEPAPIKDLPSDKPISIRKEQVTFTSQEDKSDNSYFVIIGSFSQLDNAKNYRETLLDEGFTPIILHSETGYYRVCVNSYKNETEARGRVKDLRQAFPKYADVWLLIKQ
jgi:cell division protein FtsN